MGLFDDNDALEDDDYVEDYDDEEIELDSELGTDYHEVRSPDNSISRNTEYHHPELTTPSNPTGGGSYVPIPKDAKRTLPDKGYTRKKLSAKMKHKHRIKHIIIRHKNGKRTILA